jgi:hypothetical protein
MSIVATWDLQANYSPRSLAVFPAAQVAVVATHNPFDAAATVPVEGHALAIVYGTERGSVHYRSFGPPSRTARAGLASSSSRNAASTSSAAHQLQTPLGVAQGSGRRPSANLPRHLFPIDLSSGSVPGSIVVCLQLGGTAPQSPSVPVFLLLVDDNRGTSGSSQPGAYATYLATLSHGSFHVLSTQSSLPRMSCVQYSPTTGIVYAAGRHLQTLPWEQWETLVDDTNKHARGRSTMHSKRTVFSSSSLPSPGVRSGPDGMAFIAKNKVAVVAVGNAVYGVAGHDPRDLPSSEGPVKLLSFAQSSQVHPIICLDLLDQSLDPDWSLIFLASGRECAVLDVHYGPPDNARISSSEPRHGIVTLASPILAAATSLPWVAVLTSDGLISVRSPSCMAIPLRTVEVGTRPNDYFVLRTLLEETQTTPWIVALSYSGEGRVLQCQPDTEQDLADRLMRHAIDAFGANGFPRSELAEAVNASFTATSYVGPEASARARVLLKEYLEAVLGLSDFEGGGSSGWPTELSNGEGHHGSLAGGFSGHGVSPSVVSSASPATLLTGTALLCLVSSQLSPPNSSLANRAAKASAEKMGIVVDGTIAGATVLVCELVADKLLREASTALSLLPGSSSAPITRVHRQSQTGSHTDFVEAAIWLLRSCGKHERAIDVTYEKLQQQGQTGNEASARGYWSQIKYESYTATHLSDLWGAGKEIACDLVLKSPATYRLLENNPRLGLSVFTALHPQNQSQWRSMSARDNPLSHPNFPYQVVKLLKSINPAIPYDKDPSLPLEDQSLPLESGRALVVTYIESAIGIATGRPTEPDQFGTLPSNEDFEERVANFHDELSFQLLEGVIAERRDDDENGLDTDLGKHYRTKLRRLLRWPIAKIRAETFMDSLPSSFLEEKALVLGRLGRHEDALRILYIDLDSLELALEYCDHRHEVQKLQQNQARAQHPSTNMYSDEDLLESESLERDNAYLPLIRVALESDPKKGASVAIQILALRRSAIDRAAALRLLPVDVPVSAVARPFLIPALVDSESQVRRLTVVSALLRARYVRLQDELTNAQLKAQANVHVVPQLRNLNLGDPLHSTKAFRARTTTTASPTMPNVMIIKHFFPRHLVLQVKVTNEAGYSDRQGRALSDIAFVVAESSEEAIQPLLQVPIQTLPPAMTGSAWCVLSASPGRMDGSTAQLTCELCYTVQSVDASLAGGNGMGTGRTFVEELQDLEVHGAHFS